MKMDLRGTRWFRSFDMPHKPRTQIRHFSEEVVLKLKFPNNSNGKTAD